MMQAMILAAGLGTRLKPLTDHVPKALVEVGGEPLLKQVIFKLKDAGFSRIIVNVHHFSEQIIQYLETNHYFGLDILISDETTQLLDTGGGIKAAKRLFGDTRILIHNVDILSNINLQRFYFAHKEAAATLLVSERNTNRYLLFDDDMRLVGWTNVNTGEFRSPYPNLNVAQYKKLAFAGIHTFSPQLFPWMDAFPDRFGVIDFYLSVCNQVPIIGHVESNLRLMDVGKQETLHTAEQFMHQL
ncbi:NTP transferase domain-containing protein [Hoylesella buccalis]|uniref:sugar phosphate nucleotidyltransferase n=1 Tax=Hoylesella buccalis TaxID=28127 RepID=UPI001D13E0A9|nr:sugar phosphate nucleotidyltransferase [Hoylesella buccalis]UEA64351.1 NTP transferase domain-containing protein [Hoylesella buccalis]UWP50759.1 sugar phosphate nucleotidyltransferase [Hoylesella buccalis ATCC 35310]